MIKVQIGEMERNYTLFSTRAPKAYDGFGTITVSDYKLDGGERYVLIDEPHINWQRGRYMSGMFASEEVQNMDEMIRRVLIKRLGGSEE